MRHPAAGDPITKRLYVLVMVTTVAQRLIRRPYVAMRFVWPVDGDTTVPAITPAALDGLYQRLWLVCTIVDGGGRGSVARDVDAPGAGGVCAGRAGSTHGVIADRQRQAAVKGAT